MRRIGHWMWLLVALYCWAPPGARAEADDVQQAWQALPADARLITDPAQLTALLADHTVHGINLPDGTQWREYSAADGRTVWEFDGCLHPGTWRVSGSTVCYTYPSLYDGQPQCFIVYQSRQLTHFVWLDPVSGEQWLISSAAELATGNPDQLPLDGAPTCGDPAV